MKFANAVKKLVKLGFTVTEPKDPSYPRYTARLGNKFLEIHFYRKDEVEDELGECFVAQQGSSGNRCSFGKATKTVLQK